MNPPKPTVLLIFDGFGCRESKSSNAIMLSKTPVWNELLEEYPHTQLDCSGSVVGLPDNQMGNSEVGHLHLGTGRLLPQDYTRINKAIQDRSFYFNPVLCQAVDRAIDGGKALHVLGLLSPGGVHSYEGHLAAMVELAKEKGLEEVFIHAFLDGRDTPPKSAAGSIRMMEEIFHSYGNGRIASVVGRFRAMDRDKRWNRIQQAYQLIVNGKAEYRAQSASKALELAYARGESDEFVKATSIVPIGDDPIRINDGDVVVFMNFRADRSRELVMAMTSTDFAESESEHHRIPNYGGFVTLTPYKKGFEFPVAFPHAKIHNSLGELFCQLGLKQLRLSETEKYAHVTYFFNGGREKPFDGETRILVPSPRVKTYDLKPEMSADEVTNELVKAIHSGEYDAIICNYANCDMVGHTGDLQAAIRAVETIDKALGRVVDAIKTVGGELLITADHGNIEQMVDLKSCQPHTAHTLNPVPLLYLGRDKKLAKGGSLADVAPTMLAIMGLEKPKEMTGRSLLL